MANRSKPSAHISRFRWTVLQLTLIGFASLAAGCSRTNRERIGEGASPVVYGADDRVEPFALAEGSTQLRASRASVALVDSSRLTMGDGGSAAINGPTLRKRLGLCDGEQFGDQPTAAFCSGTMITENLVLTAGHCVDEATCGNSRVVSGYQMLDAGHLAPIASDQVRSCAEVIVRQMRSDVDYAIFRLDRPLAGTAVAELRVGDLALDVGEPLFVVGYPSGLPQKVAAGAKALDPRSAVRDFFLADLDSFPGNSGGGVYRASNGELVGVLARGPNPGYEVAPGENCVRPEQVDPATGALIESVYVDQAVKAFCAVAHDDRLCSCGNGTCQGELGETTASCAEDCGSHCGDAVCNGTETGDSCYGDCGRCENAVCELSEIARMSCSADCGCPPGMMPESGSCVPSRGNVNGDDVIDVNDVRGAAKARGWQGANPAYLPAADVDCDGSVSERDRSALNDFVGGATDRLPCYAVRTLALGAQHSCVVSPAGRVRCWGGNRNGQLGLGHTRTIGDDETAGAVPFVDLRGLVDQIATGGEHTCALLLDGTVTCWGNAGGGQLGYGDRNSIGDEETPAAKRPVPLASRAIAIAAGSAHTCVILDNGTLSCWGSNWFGQLGDGTTRTIGDDETAAALEPHRFPSRVTQLALGFDHSCVLTEDGNVYCWGDNLFGQLGSSTQIIASTPIRAVDALPVPLGGPATSIAAGWWGSCATRRDGATFCWGNNSSGQLGSSSSGLLIGGPLAAGAVQLGTGVQRLVLGRSHSCALYESGSVRCWGANGAGQLGDGTSSATRAGLVPSALEPVALGGKAVDLAAGSDDTCAVFASGAVRCWGSNDVGQLGYGSAIGARAFATPAAAGDVPLAPSASVGWHFSNAFGLVVWHREDHPLHGSALVSVYVSKFGTRAADVSSAAYNFRLEVSEGSSVEARDLLPSRGASQLEPGSDGLYSLFLNFNDDRRSRNGILRTVWLRSWNASSSGSWDPTNDYSASDSLIGSGWHLTRRVQLLDSSGRVAFGWTRR